MVRNKIFLFSLISLIMEIICVEFLNAAGKSSSFRNGFLIIYILIGIIVLISIVVFISKIKRQKSVFNKLTNKKTSPDDVIKEIIKNNPDFNSEKFLEKVKISFNEMQKAREAQDMSKVRRYISDGIYQRYNTLFNMMSILKQKINIEKVEIKNINIDRLEKDGAFDIIHVAVNALVVDNIVCGLDASLNLNEYGTITEYWSFMKKRGIVEKDIYITDSCPNCGKKLSENMKAFSECESCNVVVNSSDFDWILVDIIQANDYIGIYKKIQKYASITDVVSKIGEYDDFCIQQIEDKAGNGYLQVLTALTMQDLAIIRRFITDELFEKLKMQLKMQEKGKEIVYNRVYINDVSLIGMNENDDKNVLIVSIKSSFQRIKIINNKPNKIDEAIIANNNIILLARDKNAIIPKGSLYMHKCPKCGAIVKETLKIECPKCNAPLNSSKGEWIISDIMNMHEYDRYLSENKSDILFRSTPELLDELYDVRDYAFNNVMIMIAIDGIFDAREEEFARNLAKKWGYNIKKIEPMFEMAKSGKLSIMMPENEKQRSRIIKLMEKAAGADENVSIEEAQLLKNVKEKYINDK